jgi:2-phosphosulfolactate phosphatase
MPPRVSVYTLPTSISPEALAGGTIVVIDVLRASTTIIYSLAAGAKAVIPCREIDEARAIAGRYPRDQVILGGERGGLPIEGFDLGNSPESYAPETVKGKTIVFTTTNGTRALIHARMAKQILIGAFVNASAVVQKLLGQESIHLLCAGTENQETEEDVLFAGMLVEKLHRLGGGQCELNPQAIAAEDLWLHTLTDIRVSETEIPDPERLAKTLRKTLHGKKLVSLGLERDVLAAAQIDRFAIVPEFDVKTSVVRLPRSPMARG